MSNIDQKDLKTIKERLQYIYQVKESLSGFIDKYIDTVSTRWTRPVPSVLSSYGPIILDIITSNIKVVSANLTYYKINSNNYTTVKGYQTIQNQSTLEWSTKGSLTNITSGIVTGLISSLLVNNIYSNDGHIHIKNPRF